MATLASSWTVAERLDKRVPALLFRNTDITCVAVLATSPNGPRTVLIDDDDTDLLCGTVYMHAVGYPCSSTEQKQPYVHRHVMTAKLDGTTIEEDVTVDHINWIKTDNRRANLRLATQSEQQHNRADHVDRKPPPPELIELGILRLPSGVYFDEGEAKYVYQPPGRTQISGTKSRMVTPINKFRDILVKMIADLEANPDPEEDNLCELRTRLAKEHNEIVAAAHAAEPDTFPDGPYADVDAMCSELAYCRAVLGRLPPVAPGEVLHGPRSVGKQFFPPGTPGLPAGSAALVKGDAKLLFDGEFLEQFERLPEIDFSGGVPCIPVTTPLKQLYPTLAVTTRKVNLKDLIWQYMMGKGPVPADHTLVPINYQQHDVRAENLVLLQGTGKNHKARSGMPYAPTELKIALGFDYMPRDTSFITEKGKYLLYTRAPDGQIIKIRSHPDSVGEAYTSKLLPILLACNPNFEADNAKYHRLLGEYEDFCANMSD